MKTSSKLGTEAFTWQFKTNFFYLFLLITGVRPNIMSLTVGSHTHWHSELIDLHYREIAIHAELHANVTRKSNSLGVSVHLQTEQALIDLPSLFQYTYRQNRH